ncbi:MAG: fructosamine kinase family protein [Acidiferrobacterales bacterium]
MQKWQQIDQEISKKLGESFVSSSHRPVGGGCINEAYSISDGNQTFFVKLNSTNMAPMFVAEAAGLQEIIDSTSVRAPKPVCWGATVDHSYIVMESLALGGNSTGAGAILGQQLALMHKKTSDQFGWKMNNTIGSTPQPNTYNENWLTFYGESRLAYQLELAAKNGCDASLTDKGNKLLDLFHYFFTNYAPRPSLLHGDLWSGNVAVLTSGQPTIFDPAVYYGDREADLAMTELFGGFGQPFHDAYNETWPLDPGYSTRKTLYNLYHILNHFNLFGGAYGAQAERMVEQLLSEI